MDKQYWDEILYPHFLATIRGENYIVITDDELEKELYYLTLRAIAAFKFSQVQLSYSYDDADGHRRYYFENTLSYQEIEVLLAWMKAFWAENLISNSDSFNQLYYDAAIKTYSPSAAMDKGTKLYQAFLESAKETMMWYHRETDGLPALRDLND